MQLGLIDRLRAAALSGGLRLVEELLGSANTLGRTTAAPPERPDPVVLVGGWMNTDHSWGAWQRSLRRDGIPHYVVTVPGNASGDLDEAARHLAARIEQVRAETGAAKVDIVGFSMGGLIARQYAKFHAVRDAVDALVTLATPNNGKGSDLTARLHRLVGPIDRAVFGPAHSQALRGSTFITRLNDPSIPDAAGHVRFGSVFARRHDLAVSRRQAELSGAVNVAIDGRNLLGLRLGPDHYSILHRSSDAYEAVRRILLER